MLLLCRRFVAVAITASLIIVSPGFECYQAFGAQWGERKAAQGPAKLSGVPKLITEISREAVQRPVRVEALKLITAARAPASAATAPAAKPEAGNSLAFIQTAAGAVIQDLSRPNLGGETVHQLGRSLEGFQKPRSALNVAAPEEGASAPAAVLKPAASRAAAPASRSSAVPAVVSRTAQTQGFLSRAKKVLRSASLMAVLGLVLSAVSAAANMIPHASTATAVAVSSAVPAAEIETEPAPALSPVTAELAFDRQGLTVGERVKITVTLKNPSAEEVKLSSLRSALEEVLPETLELQGKSGDEPLAVGPGASQIRTFEAIVWNSGELKLSGPLIFQVPGSAEEAQVQVSVAEAVLAVKSVLTPDWQQKGFLDIAGVKRSELADPAWLLSIPLFLILLIGVERLIAARKTYPGAGDDKLPLLTRTLSRIAALENPAAAAPLSYSRFYAELYDVLAAFLVDYHGLPLKVRDAKELAADLAASGKFDTGELQVASALARKAEAVRFGGSADSPEGRRRDLAVLKALVDKVAKRPGAAKQGLLGLLPGAAALQFGSPWALALFIPFVGYLALSRLGRRSEAFTVSSGTPLSGTKSLRQRLSWLPKTLRHAAVALVLAALAKPQVGVTRQETFTPSTDTVFALDLSGSMDEPFQGGSGKGPTKLDAAKEAEKAYIDEQRRGTTNRIGQVTFAGDAYVDLRLTTDYDALVSHLPELRTTGSTAIGKGMLSAIGNFLEVNILEMGDLSDPRIAKLQEILRMKGLPEALAFLKASPDLQDKVLQPDRKKIVVVATDGESNEGIAPADAAAIAKKLGIRVYTIGIAPKTASGQVPGYDEKTLVDIAQTTGGQFFRADDADRMREVLLEISRLEKSPARVVAAVSVNDYQNLLALLAFLCLGLEIALSNAGLRTLQALLIAGVPLSGLLRPPEARAESGLPPVVSALENKTVPAEMSEGNLLYEEGRFDEALKKYAEALEKNPDLAELYFNMGNAYMRLGDAASAQASFAKFLAADPAPGLASQAYYNLGNAAVLKRDAEQAMAMYKEALRRDPANAQAKWNLEILQKMSQKQKGQGQGQKKQKNGRKQKKQKQPQQGQPQQQPQQGQKEKSGLEQLAENLKNQEKDQAESARKSVTRKGSGMWGLAVLPLAFGKAGAALSFASPWVLGAALLIVPLAAGLIAYGISQKLKAARALTPGTAAKDFKSWWGRTRFLKKAGLALSAAMFLGLAASGPKSGFKDERVSFGGKDVVVAVDASYSSIFAEDGRLDKTKKELGDFVSSLQGTDRVGLVAFSGKARTASPLSIDYGNFDFKIGRLEAEGRGLDEGSDIGAGIKASLNSFERVKQLPGRRRILILVSDGEAMSGSGGYEPDNEESMAGAPSSEASGAPDQNLQDALQEAKKRGVVIYTIGVGSPEGTKMKVPTRDGASTEYLVDSRTGQPALTKLDESSLRRIAEATGGAYFRAGPGASIRGILSRVSELQQGEKSNAVKSPRSLSGWALVLALLALLGDMLLPAASVLKKGAAPGPKKDEAGPSSGGMLGLAFLPLGVWPQIFPLALLLTAAAGLVLADSLTGGALVRRLRWFIERRRNTVAKGIQADLGRLFDLRAADQETLAAFLEAWKKTEEPKKSGLLAEAVRDAGLWRQKLILAYLWGNTPETQEDILAAIPQASKSHLESVEPVVQELLARRGKLSWLDHIDASQRLARLAPVSPEDLAGSPAARFTKAKAVSASLMAALVAFTGVSGVKTLQYQSEKTRAMQESTRIFYGEDLFIFSDRYVDPAIPQRVLPALKDWSEEPARRGGKLDEAVAILVKSPDPKADNVLEAIFKHADLLGLSPKAEEELLSTMVQRENEEVWRFMDRQIALSGDNPRVAARLQRMIALAATLGGEKTFLNLFRFLRSPDREVQGQAMQAIGESLTTRDRIAQYYDRLSAAQGKYASAPDIGLWIEGFALMRLGAPVSSDDASKAERLMDTLLDAAVSFDLQRAQALAAAKSPEEVPGSVLEAFFRQMEHTAKSISTAKTATEFPAPLAAVIKHSVNRTMSKLVAEGEGLYGGLHGELLKAGVAWPDLPAVAGHGRGGGYRPQTPVYREVYRLQHLRDASRLIGAAGQAASANATPQSLEYLDRAAKALKAMESIGRAAGMREGTAPGDKAADEVNVLLGRGFEDFGGHRLYEGLRAAGLASDAGSYSGEARWLETYSREDLAKLRAFFKDAALGANKNFYLTDGGGRQRAFSIAEKLRLIKAMDELERIAAKHYPDGKTRGARSLWKTLAAPGEEKLVLTRLYNALNQRSDKAFRGQVLAYLERWLASPKGRGADPEEVSDIIGLLVEAAAKEGREAAVWRELIRALGVRPKGPLAAAVLLEVQSKAQEMVVRASGYFTDFKDTMVRLRIAPAYGMGSRQYKIVQLRALRRAVALEAGKIRVKGKLSEKQKEVADRGEAILPLIIQAGALAGLPLKETTAEVVGGPVDDLLYEGFKTFNGTDFLAALRDAGLAPKVSTTDFEQAYYHRYSKQDLVKLRKFLGDLLASGVGYDRWDMMPAPLTDKETQYLRKSIKEIDALVQLYPEPSTSLHGFAFLGLGALVSHAAWSALGAVLAGGLILAGLYWLARRFMPAATAGEASESSREGPSAEVLRRYQKIELAAKKLADSASAGSFKSFFRGAGGSEFAESKLYQSEDIRDIDWKTSAKQGELYAKKYELEKEMPFLLLVDVSRSSRFGTRGADKKTVIEDVSAALALAASRMNLRVGALFFTDKVEAYLEPRSGRDQARIILRRLFDLKPEGRGTDLKPALNLALKAAGSRAVVAVVSDFLAPDFNSELSAVSRRHDLRVLRVFDPAETRPLPDVGLIRVQDAETGEVREVDTSSPAFRAQQAAMIAQQERKIAEAFRDARARPLALSTEGDYLESLLNRFDPKKKERTGVTP